MGETEQTTEPVVEAPVIQSPPAAPVAAHVDDGPRVRLHEVAAALSRGLNRQLLAEYLQLRRACR
ncbi:MAG TPA: hypothetical protein VG722_09320 [Tepidisphaeraceae bacterium]|nr:hypothetical protein [Tepidisphaeraceae bacterium]